MATETPRPRTKYYDHSNNRLVYRGASSDEGYWDGHWSKAQLERVLRESSRSPGCRMVVEVTRRFLPPGSRVLDGGCGLGDKVKALADAGYESYGVDYASRIVATLNASFPELRISHCDVRRIEVSDGFYHGYWSLGVIEHFYDGYDAIIAEAYRIIAPSGLLFVTVPAMSPLRRLKAKAGLYRPWPTDAPTPDDFYQFALPGAGIAARVQRQGFELLERRPLNGITGLSDEFPLLRWPLKVVWKLAYRPAERLLAGFSNHTDLFVFRRLAQL
ncbi:class I SAM-dependent methyltransferase [Blastochloris sulfoviridis]|uniref:class I SAM-dependent methyltransferase n=1 Tax=Blastochloris sulfoviridis TaxID=50712 RepID=UPI0014788081|nr:methyltransferase domain-containing protein [Blastochloris sulfoviridis]